MHLLKKDDTHNKVMPCVMVMPKLTIYHPFETQIFDTFMTTLFCLPVHTVHHVPQMVRPLLASAVMSFHFL